MTAEVVEGEIREIPERALAVVSQPGQSLVAEADDPSAMVAVASRLASALKDIVEQQKLYAVIQGKKYPQVEAWMTIARLDNVVAREPQAPIRHEDGSYEAFADLIRLSDGMVIGSSSALCGTPDDKPWGSRSEPARRSMAQTRATSRAFRQQYSWIMALAGYQPTPAEEMPLSDPEPVRPALEHDTDGSIIGTAEATDKATSDFELRQTPEGGALGFRLRSGGSTILVECRGALAEQVSAFREATVGQRVTVWGAVGDRTFPKGRGTVTYQVLAAERIRIPEVGDLPTAVAPVPDGKVADLDTLDF